jgi:hypothetical protein
MVRIAISQAAFDAIGNAIKEEVLARAKERMSEGGKGWKVSTPSEPRKSRDEIGARVGMSGRTWEKASAVVDAASLDQETFGLADLPQMFDLTREYPAPASAGVGRFNFP